jgi:hypothetical protein
MFYTFRQNNSFGIVDQDDHLDFVVIIESDSEHEAIQKALNIGIYFDGVDEGLDCACCGDRWSQSDIECNDTPMIYDIPIDKFHPYRDGLHAIIHHTNGKVVKLPLGRDPSWNV